MEQNSINKGILLEKVNEFYIDILK